MKEKELKRFFKYKNQKLPDPDPKMLPSQVAEIYSTRYPELVSAKVSGPKIEKDEQIYEFTTKIGTNG